MAARPADAGGGGADAPVAAAAAAGTSAPCTGVGGAGPWPGRPEEPAAAPSARPRSQLPRPSQPRAEEPQPGGHLLRRHKALSFIRQCLQSQGEISPNVWKRLLGMLLLWVKLKRQHADLEETLPEHILDLIVQLLPRALPELQQAAMAFASVKARAVLLQQPELREHIDSSVLPRIPVEDASSTSCEECPEGALQALAVVVLAAGLTAACAAAASPWAEPAAAGTVLGEQEPCMGDPGFKSLSHQLSQEDEQPLAENDPSFESRQAFDQDRQLLVEPARGSAFGNAGALAGLAGSMGKQQHWQRLGQQRLVQQQLGQQCLGPRRKQMRRQGVLERLGPLQSIPEGSCIRSSTHGSDWISTFSWETSTTVTLRHTMMITAHSAEAAHATFLHP